MLNNMKIDNELRESHRLLSKSNVDFIDYVERNPHILDRSLYKKVYEAKYDYIYPQPWPIYINPTMRGELEAAGRDIFRLVKSVPGRIFNNDARKLGEYLHIPPGIIEKNLEGVTSDHLKGVLGRGDFILSDSGLKCLEYNVSGSVGGWPIALMEPVHLSIPALANFLREYEIKPRTRNLIVIFFEHLLEDALNKFPGTGEVNIAVAIAQYGRSSEETLKQYHLDQTYQETLQANYPHLIGDIFFGDYKHLEISNNKLFFNGKEIHVLLELHLGEVPPEIMEVFKAGNVVLYDGPVAPLLSNKLLFAALSEHQDSEIFSPEEREQIRKYIPWTRKIISGETTYRGERIDLEQFLFSNRENMVIKPADGLGGESVCVGKYSSDLLWKEMVKVAFRNKNWLVQEYFGSLTFLFQTKENTCCAHDVIWGVFVFGEYYAGTFIRVLPRVKNIKGVINAHLGAESSFVVDVDE